MPSPEVSATHDESGVRLAELMAALSVAVDLGTGSTIEHAQRSAIVAARLAEAAGLAESEAQDAYYLALLRTVGCTGDHDVAYRLLGEDAGEWAGFLGMAGMPEALGTMMKNVGRQERGLRRARSVVRAFAGVPTIMKNVRIHCEVGTLLSRRLGLGAGVVAGLDQVFERWDGGGAPHRRKGEEIALSVRVAQLAGDIELFCRTFGAEAAVSALKQRAGKGHDPRLVEAFCRNARSLLAAREVPSVWEAVLEAEPGARRRLAGAALDEALRSAGEFADLKSSYTHGHSAAVSRLAAGAAERLGLSPSQVRAVGRAGHVHDLGRVSVFAFVWDKAEPLTDGERERVRLHSYYTERILSRLSSLAPVPAIAALAHERHDGSGYHRQLHGAGLPAAGEVLAAADVYQALVSARPHRPARSADEAAAELEAEARSGRLGPEAVRAVLAAAGVGAAPPSGRAPRAEAPRGLTARELDVLRLLARGLTNKEIASALEISVKTAGHHIEHIFDKVNVTTRAAATLFAMQNDLLD